jgi:hypothetical protein
MGASVSIGTDGTQRIGFDPDTAVNRSRHRGDTFRGRQASTDRGAAMTATSRLLATVFALAVASSPVLADEMNALPPQLQSPAAPAPTRHSSPPAAPRAEAEPTSMDFRIVEGRGVFGLTRWIQASGPIDNDTPARFEAFAASNRVAGLTVVLDSPGGSLIGGLQLGRAFRASAVNTMVGRTVARMENGRPVATMIVHQIECNSACSYALLGGLERRVASTSVVALHQFSRRRGADGRYLNETPTVEDFERAQWVTAQIAVYIQEMGVDMRFLAIASNRPYGQQLHILTTGEMSDLRAAMPVAANEAERMPVSWSTSLRSDSPMLYRRGTRVAGADRRVDEEVYLMCNRDADSFALQVRLVLSRVASNEQLSVTTARFNLAGQPVEWRTQNGQPLRTSGQNSSLWVTVNVPRQALAEAARTGRLEIELPGDAQPSGRTEIGEGLGQALPGFAAACDAQRQRITAQAN